MKLIYNICALLFCIITLGIIDLEIKYSDGTRFKWVGWVSRVVREEEDDL